MSFPHVFGGVLHLSDTPIPPILLLVNITYLLNIYLYPYWTRGGGFKTCITRQGTIEASTHMGLDVYLLVQKLYRQLVSVDTLWKDAGVQPVAILTADEALCDLDTFYFVATHIFN